ncbi:dTDP-4-dehydrorhamnose 3,5-epimerase [Mangrovibacterium marinum]|uniref:dTDP-4-dehydrorhamnose 3,5-epimerase n=1 Tax=Mangrovibacterium marinum TaxID=1639118 RepID=A0A2T5BXZ8_9BACT|nr:dTDP-4-dehydrorhamnose 3,5-epimerase [Mangrovibacterium marinum]PTN06325.1 dTDP-4-dehydrorhamnose 3,5-epimerase [Mangrovibacterium marinum]
MQVETSPLEGLVILTPRVFEDERGYFFESFHALKYKQAGIEADFVQDNESRSSQGVIRGLHYQTGTSAQAKLVRVTEGVVWDVAVDLRPQSTTFGQWYGVELSAANKKQLFIPRGFAHGFAVLSPKATLTYKCDNFYNPQAEGGIRYDDPDLKIDWPIDCREALLSEKDMKNGSFRELQPNW